MITEKEKKDLGVFDTIEEMYDFVSSSPKDQKGKNSIHWIGHYMHVLKDLASECDSITELGVNEVNSTWAFMIRGRKK